VDPQDFKAPFIDRPQIWREADAFRDRYWPSEKIPVDVLAIVEFELGLEIRPVSRMREEEDIDALLLGNWRTLMVDLRHYMDDRYLNRLRFSVAHELGHYVLHKQTSVVCSPWSRGLMLQSLLCARSPLLQAHARLQ
jgi:hypothetical protein